MIKEKPLRLHDATARSLCKSRRVYDAFYNPGNRKGFHRKIPVASESETFYFWNDAKIKIE